MRQNDSWHGRPARRDPSLKRPPRITGRQAPPRPTDPSPRAARGIARPGASTAAAPGSRPLPERLLPQLATLVDRPPEDEGGWAYEVKLDGYRILARIDASDIRLISRNGNDWSAKLPGIVTALRRRPLPDGWYDGEIVILNAAGIPDFSALQNAFDGRDRRNISYFLFDLPWLEGEDLRMRPLAERRRRLAAILGERDGPVRFSATLQGPAQALLEDACRKGLEGIIGKHRDAVYTEGRARSWIKLKCSRRQEFVIGGFTDPQGSRTGLGSLALGVYDASGALRHVGNVGTGFDDPALVRLRGQLDALATTRSPFSGADAVGHDVHWVQPRLVAEVSFGEWTRSGHVRHAVFLGLRDDKPARSIVRERAAEPPGTQDPVQPAETTKASTAAKAPPRTGATRRRRA